MPLPCYKPSFDKLINNLRADPWVQRLIAAHDDKTFSEVVEIFIKSGITLNIERITQELKAREQKFVIYAYTALECDTPILESLHYSAFSNIEKSAEHIIAKYHDTKSTLIQNTTNNHIC